MLCSREGPSRKEEDREAREDDESWQEGSLSVNWKGWPLWCGRYTGHPQTLEGKAPPGQMLGLGSKTGAWWYFCSDASVFLQFIKGGSRATNTRSFSNRGLWQRHGARPRTWDC